MSQHRFVVPPEARQGERITFSATQAHQLRDVLRLRQGERVRVFDGVEPIDLLVELSGPASARIVERCAQPPEPRTTLVAYPALLQRDKFETVLQKLTELGVSSIVPLITARSLVREAPDERRLTRWQAILREAAEQCGRGRLPVLRPTLRFADALGGLEGSALMAFEGERQVDLHQALAQRPSCVSLLVGPEGGYTAEEADQARTAGVRLVTLGPRVLRAETASAVLPALVLYELGDLSSSPV